MEVICIKDKPHPKVSFTKGNTYKYSVHKNPDGKSVYIVTSNKPSYVNTFHEGEFEIYFMSLQDFRNKKLDDLGI